MRLEAQLLLDGLDGVAYLTDPEGVILAVSHPGWNRFADHTAGELAAAPIGCSLFDSISGAEVAIVYRHLHAALLAGERSHVAFEHRCDAPDFRREMRMSISVVRPPGADPMLLYQSQMLTCVTRPWMKLFEADRILAQARSEAAFPIIRICGFCHKVAWPRGESDEWIEPEDYYRRGGCGEVRTSHGVCGPCVQNI